MIKVTPKRESDASGHFPRWWPDSQSTQQDLDQSHNQAIGDPTTFKWHDSGIISEFKSDKNLFLL